VFTFVNGTAIGNIMQYNPWRESNSSSAIKKSNRYVMDPEESVLILPLVLYCYETYITGKNVKICRFVRTSQETQYVSATSPTG
jgi:hypothetical protein